ncbi:MAG TPA: cytochrome c oxidase assembly protein [Gaiellaceae bacterium]
MSWGGWEPAPVVLGFAAVAALRFAQGFVRLRRRGRQDHADWTRPVLFTAGLALAVLPLVSPLDRAGDEYLISAHMLQHVLIGDAAPALLLLSVRGPLLAFVLPAPAGRLLARVERLPVWASLALWSATVAAWHVPAAYDFALTHQWAHDLEHASFVTAGFLVWTQLVDPARRRRLSTGQRLAFAGCLFVLGQLLADLLFLSSPLYPAYAAQPVRLLGLSPAADQQLAGLAMMVEQTLTLGAFAVLVLRNAMNEPAKPWPQAALATPSKGRAGFARTACLNREAVSGCEAWTN